MERCRYITANDFFAINYSMMFSVRELCSSIEKSAYILCIQIFQMFAVIVTNMVILFQFRQWSDTQIRNTIGPIA